jgi:hypothetical protein
MIRKIALLVVIAVLVPTVAFGLELTLGARAGLGHFGAWGEDYTDTIDAQGASRVFDLGYSFGLYGSFALIDMLAIQPELWYTRGGYAFDGDDDIDFTASTLEAPVLAKLRFGIGPISAVGFAGPNFRFKVGDFEMDGGGADINQDDYSTAVIGSVLGAGAELNIGVGILSADARYYLDFMPWDDTGDSDIRDQSVRFTVGYGIPIL